VLDTVIEYGDTLVLVVENKVAEAGSDQALNLNVEGAGAQRAERPAARPRPDSDRPARRHD
jgi:hypothetical protein